MGCKTEGDLPRLIHKYTITLTDDPHDTWIKVVDTRTGCIAAASNWKVYLNSAPTSSDDQPPEWLDGDALDRSREMLAAINLARKRANPCGYVRE
jgi:hypothetical protein